MRTKQTSLRTLLASLLVAGGVGVACSSHQRSPESTTVAQAPLGRSTADYPSNPSVAPPDAAEAPEQQVGPAHPLSSGAVGGATTAPATNNPNATGPNGATPTGNPPIVPNPNPGPTFPTPTNPSTPNPTPSSPNAPSPTPAPNPMPPSGGSPVPSQPTPGAPPSGTAPQSSLRGLPSHDIGARTRESANASPSVSPAVAAPFDPYQVRSDGGIAPPAPARDAGTAPGRSDGGVVGIRNDGGVGGIRLDGGAVTPAPRGDGGLR